MMKEIIEHQRELLGNDTEPELQLLAKKKEVAVIFVTKADGNIFESYVTIRHKYTQVL